MTHVSTQKQTLIVTLGQRPNLERRRNEGEDEAERRRGRERQTDRALERQCECTDRPIGREKPTYCRQIPGSCPDTGWCSQREVGKECFEENVGFLESSCDPALGRRGRGAGLGQHGTCDPGTGGRPPTVASEPQGEGAQARRDE